MANVNKRPFVKFFHQDWCSDNDVDNMSMQEVGTYWTLLVRQMVEGHVKSDLSNYLKRLNVASIQEAMLLVTPRVAKKFHTASCSSETCSGWNCSIEGDDPSKLYNRKLREVIRDMDDTSWKNKQNVNSRYNGGMPTKSLESGVKGNEAPAIEFDFSELLRIMPKRRVKGNFEGWDAGRAMLKYITTQDEYDNLMAATRAYARSRKGEDAAFHIALNNWVTKEYYKHIPAVVETSAPASVAASTAAPAPKRISKSWCVPDGVKLARSTDSPPPWIVNDLDFEAKREAALKFPDEASKHRWWMTSDSDNKNVGA